MARQHLHGIRWTININIHCTIQRSTLSVNNLFTSFLSATPTKLFKTVNQMKMIRSDLVTLTSTKPQCIFHIQIPSHSQFSEVSRSTETPVMTSMKEFTSKINKHNRANFLLSLPREKKKRKANKEKKSTWLLQMAAGQRGIYSRPSLWIDNFVQLVQDSIQVPHSSSYLFLSLDTPCCPVCLVALLWPAPRRSSASAAAQITWQLAHVLLWTTAAVRADHEHST